MSVSALNPDLTQGNVRPGVYVSVNLSAPGGGIGQVQKRLLVVGYKQASGTYPPDNPTQPLSQSEVDAGCGVRSDAARGYGAAISEVGAGNIDVFVLPLIAPSGGIASIYKMIFAGTATAPGSVDVSIDGRFILTVGFSTGDTPTIIAAAVNAAINALTDAPLTSTASTGTLTLTYPHKGDVGEDCPVRAVVNGVGTGVTASPGFVGFSGSATGAGSIQFVMGGTTVTAPLAGGETANQQATLLAAAINAGAYPVTAAVDSVTLSQVNFFYAVGRDTRRFTVAVIGSTGVTVTLTNGTIGSGQPSLTAAISNLSALTGFRQWAVPFTGTQAIPDLTTLGTISSAVELRANGLNQQEQGINAVVTWPSSTAGTIPVGTSPALTASPRYVIGWSQDLGTQGFEAACRMAAARVNNDYPPHNWDGYAFKSSTLAPLILPAQASRPSGDIINLAMRSFFLTPLRVNETSNQLVVEKGTTTSNSTYLPLRDWSTIDQIAFWRFDQARMLVANFSGISAKRFSPSRTPNTITVDSVQDAAYLLALDWDDNDLYDGAATFKSGFKATFNNLNPERIDLVFPMSPVLPVHQIGSQGNLVSPSA